MQFFLLVQKQFLSADLFSSCFDYLMAILFLSYINILLFVSPTTSMSPENFGMMVILTVVQELEQKKLLEGWIITSHVVWFSLGRSIIKIYKQLNENLF